MDISRINSLFYESAMPHKHFLIGLASLMAMGGKPDQFASLLESGVQIKGTTLALTGGVMDETEMNNHVLLSSQVLAHHATETLLRLFLAHRRQPPCPWQEIAKLRKPAEMKQIVQREIVDGPFEELGKDVDFVFLGGQGTTYDEADPFLEATVQLTQHVKRFGEYWINDAPIYNSAKHGLTVIPGEMTLSVADDDGSYIPVKPFCGDSITFWEKEKGEAGASWVVKTKWIDVDETLGIVHVACQMLRSLWEIARARYIGAPPPDHLYVPGQPQPLSNNTMTIRQVHEAGLAPPVAAGASTLEGKTLPDRAS